MSDNYAEMDKLKGRLEESTCPRMGGVQQGMWGVLVGLSTGILGKIFGAMNLFISVFVLGFVTYCVGLLLVIGRSHNCAKHGPGLSDLCMDCEREDIARGMAILSAPRNRPAPKGDKKGQ